ncbi:C-type mannose receptor 2-like [Branchiostoma floridae x Branchiostoma belcheri]
MAPSCLAFSKVALAIMLNIGVCVCQCPDQSIAFNHACYEFSTAELGYAAARLYCAERNGTLAMPRTAAVDAYIVGILQYSGYQNGYWIGIEPSGVDGAPMWADDTPVFGGLCQYSAFAEGEPNFPGLTLSRMPQQCAMIGTAAESGFLWATSTCAFSKRFICQYGAGDQEDCSDIGLILAWSDQTGAADQTSLCCQEFPEFVTSSARRHVVQLTDGVAIPNSTATVRIVSTTAWSWFPRVNFPCPVPDCPPGYHKLKDTCYGARLELANYTQAERACAEDGGTLAMPKHLKTDFFLIGLMIRAAPEGDFWIGIDDRRWEYNHMFADGTRLSECAFTKWSGVAPRDRAHFLNCVMYLPDVGYFWHDMSCWERMYFICQMGPGITDDCEAEPAADTTTSAATTTTRNPTTVARTTQAGPGASTAPVWPRPGPGSTPPPLWPRPGPGSTPPPLWPRPGPGSTPPFVPLTVSGQGGAAAAREQHAAGAGRSAAIAGGTVGAAAAVGVGVGAAVLVYKKKLLLTKVLPIGKA